MKWAARIAAALVIAGGIATVAIVLGSRDTGVSFGQVRRQIQEAKTISFTLDVSVPPPTFRAMRTKPGSMTSLLWYTMFIMGGAHGSLECHYKAPASYHVTGSAPAVAMLHLEWLGPNVLDEVAERNLGKVVLVADYEKNRQLLLLPDRKLACTSGLADLSADFPFRFRDLITELKEAMNAREKVLETTEIDGRQAKGFRVARSGDVWEVWADAETGRPLRLVANLRGKLLVTISDLVLDPKLADSLFPRTPPKGYTIKDLAEAPPGADDWTSW